MTDELMAELVEFMKQCGVPDYALPECGHEIMAEIRRWDDNRNVKHFTHEYLIAIRRLPIEWGGGYMACIPQLGSAGFHGDGQTPEEALNDLHEVYEFLANLWAEKGERWPEPKDEGAIIWGDKESRTPEEVHSHFQELLKESWKRQPPVKGKTQDDSG